MSKKDIKLWKSQDNEEKNIDKKDISLLESEILIEEQDKKKE